MLTLRVMILKSGYIQPARGAISLGHVGVLVDAPKEGEKARPYWVNYAPKRYSGWRTEIIDGVRKLTQLRLMEQVVESDGKYGEKIVNKSECLSLGGMKFIEKIIRVNINYMMRER